MRKLLVEAFFKETTTHEISLEAGIIPDPPDPYPNAIFYLQMESREKETGRSSKAEPIWLSLNEMMELSFLMAVATRFLEKRLDKGDRYSRRRIKAFIRMWDRMRDSIDRLFED